jgi:3-oxoacyl-[acyl-carrier-protein] synthase II
MRRVVVTGMGMLTPLGLNVKDTWAGILAGKSGVTPIDFFDVSQYTTQFSASVHGFDPEVYMNSKEARKVDIFVQFAVAASLQAMEDAGLEITDANRDRIGVAIGSGIGGLPSIEKNYSTILNSGPKRISPFFIPGTIINMASGYISILKGLRGPTISIVTACTTSAHNIGQAMRMIAYGDADVMLAGGAEMATCPSGLGGFAAMRALSTRNDAPQKASRPWDKDRDGFVLGDGAGVLILEEYEYAKKRGAKIYAELAGFGMSSDAYHVSAPDPDGNGFVRCMQNALNDAAVPLEAIDYINAHGTSTPKGDELEAMSIKKLFGDHAYKLAVSSTKSMTGHLLGAAGAVEAIFSILALQDQVLPPTINLDNPDVGCDLNFVAHQPQKRTVKAVLSNSFGFGGTNGSLIFTAL